MDNSKIVARLEHNIPESLKQRRIWAITDIYAPNDKGKSRKFTHVSSSTKKHASNTDPASWMTFDDVMAVIAAGQPSDHVERVKDDWITIPASDVVMMLPAMASTEDIVPVDMDGFSQETVIEPWAKHMLQKHPTYTEWSVSNRGLHAIYSVPDMEFKSSNHKLLPSDEIEGAVGEMEIFMGHHWITLTGNMVSGSKSGISTDFILTENHLRKLEEKSERSTPSDWVRPETSVLDIIGGDDPESVILERMDQDPRAHDLMHSQGNSTSDYALINKALFYCNMEPMVAEGILLRTGAYRAKWDSRRPTGTYLQESLANALTAYDGKTFDWGQKDIPEEIAVKRSKAEPMPSSTNEDMSSDGVEDSLARALGPHVEEPMPSSTGEDISSESVEEPRKQHYRIVSAEDLEGMDCPRIKPLIGDRRGRMLISTSDNFIMHGNWRVGKTWIALDQGISIALGQDWLGQFPVEQRSVLYIGAEGTHGTFQDRMRQLCRLRGIDPSDLGGEFRFMVMSEQGRNGFRLDKTESCKYLISDLENDPPGLIIFDPLSGFRVGKEDDEGFGIIGDNCRQMRAILGSVIGISHHDVKNEKSYTNDPSKRARGSGNLVAGMGAVSLEGDRHTDGWTVSVFANPKEGQGVPRFDIRYTAPYSKEHDGPRLSEIEVRGSMSTLKGAKLDIMNAILESGDEGMTVKQLNAKTGRSAGQIGRELQDLKDENRVRPNGGTPVRWIAGSSASTGVEEWENAYPHQTQS